MYSTKRLHKHCVSNFDRLVDPKGEGAARIIPLGSTKQLKKLHHWVRLFYCLLVRGMELWLSVHNQRLEIYFALEDIKYRLFTMETFGKLNLRMGKRGCLIFYGGLTWSG
jgi:hypothetical protein